MTRITITDAGYGFEPEPPGWARRSLAWAACLTNALPIAVLLIALAQWLFGPISSLAQAVVYGAVLASWIALFRPWSPCD